jgi:hypothetical protein
MRGGASAYYWRWEEELMSEKNTECQRRENCHSRASQARKSCKKNRRAKYENPKRVKVEKL